MIIGRNDLRLGKSEVLLIENGLYFTSAACLQFNLKPLDYIHFINEEDEWSFYKSDDKDGFNLASKNKDKAGLMVNSKPLARMMARTMKIKFGARFNLESNGAQKNGSPIVNFVVQLKINSK